MLQRLLPAILLLAGLVVSSATEVRGQSYFGRNKVQYRAIDMQVIETEHFLIHFDESTRIAALAAAQMAERAYTRLSRILQHEFREKKPIIIYASHSEFQQTNAIPDFIDEGTGAFAEPIRNRIVIPFTGAQAEFEHVLTHELVHAFQFDVLYRRGLMTDAAPFARPPLWFMEGMAEYLSIGHVDAHTQSWVRDASLAGYLRTIEQMSQQDDYLSYRFGQSLWAYIGANWGDEAIGVILQQAPRVGLSRAFQRTLGISVSELGREWVSE
ncbi:MAG TPA: basic secretory protein-like protein, partial [Thermomicrobiales bacterium]|nr:basic secretory protein-like protein [Thermomicrobiales bacterium]